MTVPGVQEGRAHRRPQWFAPGVVTVVGAMALSSGALWWTGVFDLIGSVFGSIGDEQFSSPQNATLVEMFRNLVWAVSFGVAGVVAIVGLLLAGMRTDALGRQTIVQTRQAEIDTARAKTETVKLEYTTFTKCFEQLGDQRSAVRLGSVLALEKLAQGSPRLRQPILEAFCASIRENRPLRVEDPDGGPIAGLLDEAVPTYMQAILTAIGRQNTDDIEGEIDLSHADLMMAKFKGANLSGAKLSNSNFLSADLGKANLTGADLQNTHLKCAILKGADLSRANLKGAVLSGANLIGANLEGAILEYAKLCGSFLWEANLRGTNLLGANLESAGLEGANLEGADLLEANLQTARLGSRLEFSTNAPDGGLVRVVNISKARLRDANLNNADLTGADLTGSDLSEANLSGANLNGAKLLDADFGGANLRGAKLPENWRDQVRNPPADPQ